MTSSLARSQPLRHVRHAAAQIAGLSAAKTLMLGAVLALSACGGGNQPAASSTSSDREQAATKPSTDAEAYRFLTQATFGPTPYQAARLKEIGYSQWIDEQLDAEPSMTHVATVEASAAALGRNLNATKDDTNAIDLNYSWWTHAIKDDQAQLRHRVAFALSEIFVVSSISVGTGRTLASYLDMLTDKSTGKNEPHTYRDLLEGVAMHPAMGQYLSHLANVKADGQGRVPDENFAREVMQLFSIGLYDLDDGGQPQLVNGKPVESYDANDIKGLARVFTGFSWMWPASKSDQPWWKCFWRSTECYEPSSQNIGLMQGYVLPLGQSQLHESGAKTFLRTTIAAQDEKTSLPKPEADLNVALNTLANHRNTAPFISRQLIQRLVTSNPSAAYVTDITRTFRDTGGDLRAVVKAILMHREARQPATDAATQESYGKLREPVLRLTHLLRALPHTSESYAASGKVFYAASDTSDAASALGQTPMRAPSVFNFFRPGYSPPQSAIAAKGLVAPEAQIATETTALGYANYVSNVLEAGWGEWNSAKSHNDVQFDYSAWTSLATKPAELVDAIAKGILGQTLDSGTRTAAITAVDGMPKVTSDNLRRRVQATILLVAVSPSFMIQQ